MEKRIKTEIFGKKVRKPADITDLYEFESYALEPVENRVNDYIHEKGIAQSDIVTYKVRTKMATERVKREIKGGKTIFETVQVMNVRIYLSYICPDNYEYI